MGVKFLKLSVLIFEENKVNSYLTKLVSSYSASSHQLETCILLSFGPLTPRLEYRRATPKGIIRNLSYLFNINTQGHEDFLMDRQLDRWLDGQME